jgi:hypothetical protein
MFVQVKLSVAPFSTHIPPLPSHNTRYQAPEAPAADFAATSARLQALENALAGLSFDNERVVNVEGGVREALEMGEISIKTGGAVAGAAWWNKITSSGKKALTIKASDGRDVTELRRSPRALCVRSYASKAAPGAPKGVQEQVTARAPTTGGECEHV